MEKVWVRGRDGVDLMVGFSQYFLRGKQKKGGKGKKEKSGENRMERGK